MKCFLGIKITSRNAYQLAKYTRCKPAAGIYIIYFIYYIGIRAPELIIARDRSLYIQSHKTYI